MKRLLSVVALCLLSGTAFCIENTYVAVDAAIANYRTLTATATVSFENSTSENLFIYLRKPGKIIKITDETGKPANPNQLFPPGSHSLTVYYEAQYTGDSVPVKENHIEFMHNDVWVPIPSVGVATVELKIKVPNRFTVFSNSQIVKAEKDDDNTIYCFAPEKARMSPPFVAGDYKPPLIVDGENGIQYRAYYISNVDDPRALIEYVKDKVNYYTSAYGPFPYKTFTIYESRVLPSKNGVGSNGMLALAGDVYTSKDALFQPHEIAHAYWGTLINAQITDAKSMAMLTEGLATYSALDYLAHKDAAMLKNGLCRTKVMQDYESIILQNVTLESNRMAAMAKTALFFFNLQQIIGDENFHAALKEFVSEYSWRMSTVENLLALVEKHAPDKTEAGVFINKWMNTDEKFPIDVDCN